MKRVISLALAVLFIAALLVGCGDSSDGGSVDPVGSYKIKTIDGKTVEDVLKAELESSGMGDMSLDKALELLGITSLDDYMTLELKSDGSAVMTSMGGSSNGTWKQDGSKVSVTFEGDTQEFKLSGNELSGTDSDGTEYVFEKK